MRGLTSEQAQIKEVALNVWALFCGLFPELKDKPKPLITFDKRVKKVWAYASCGKVQFGFHDSINNVALYLHEIAGHEIAHVVQIYLYPDTEDHGKEWQDLMRMIGLEPHSFYGNAR